MSNIGQFPQGPNSKPIIPAAKPSNPAPNPQAIPRNPSDDSAVTGSNGATTAANFNKALAEINKQLLVTKPNTPQQPPLDPATTNRIRKQLSAFLGTLNKHPAILNAMAAVKDANGKPAFDLNQDGKVGRDELVPFFNAVIGTEKNPEMYDKSGLVLSTIIGQISSGKLKVPTSVKRMLSLSGDGSLGKPDAAMALQFFATIKPKPPQPKPPITPKK